MTSRGKIGEFTNTGSNGGVFSFEWSIPYFHSLVAEVGDFYMSPLFDCCKGEWFLTLHPRGVFRNPLSESLSLFLCRGDAGPPKALDVTLGIRGEEGVENRRRRSQEFTIYDDTCCWDSFCSRLELRDHRSRLMPENVLVISLDMKNKEAIVATGRAGPRVGRSGRPPGAQ